MASSGNGRRCSDSAYSDFALLGGVLLQDASRAQASAAMSARRKYGLPSTTSSGAVAARRRAKDAPTDPKSAIASAWVTNSRLKSEASIFPHYLVRFYLREWLTGLIVSHWSSTDVNQ